MGRIFLLLFSFLITTAVSAAPPVIELQSSIKRYDVGQYADYLEDKAGAITIEDVLSPNSDLEWTKNNSSTPNFTFSTSVYWLRLNLRSTIPHNTSWLFEIAFPLQDYIDYYVVQNGKILSNVNTGDRRAFTTRTIDYRNFLFPLAIPSAETQQIYIRLDTSDGLHEPCPMILWDTQEFTLKHGERSLGLGLYFGIMVVMALYNLFVYLSMRDKTYLYYVAYILGFSLWLFTYYGFSFQYLWPNSPNLGNQSIVVLTSLWTIFIALFVRSFLNSAQYIPWFDKVMRIYIGCMVITIIVSFSGVYSVGILSVIGFGIPASIAGIVAGVHSWRTGYRPARFFLLAWSVLLVSLTIFSLKISGLIPPIWIIERSIQIGSAIEVILLSLGLADRINTLKKEKIIAQKESIKSIESNLKLKTDFITSISHELRTPMNAILGGIEVAKDEDHDKSRESLSIIRSGANDMMRLVDDILIHTELQSGQLAVKKESANVSSAVSRLVDYYSVQCNERNLQLKHKVMPNVPDWIKTDKHKLTVILTKLLDNAVKFTEQGEISLIVSLDEDTSPPTLVCAISDTGPGIPKDRQDIIFDPFVQMEGGFTRRHSGMGIGLSICRRLAETLGGTLKVSSTPGEGSQFTFRSPLEVGEAILELSNNPLSTPDLPILVVEDNLVNQKVIVKILKKIGFSSVVANHGAEALEILEKQPFSLILMDLQMPVMDGFHCTSAIRESNTAYQNIPIIAVTANVMDQDKTRCVAVQMNDFLEKPVKLPVLKECLSQYIDIAISGAQEK